MSSEPASASRQDFNRRRASSKSPRFRATRARMRLASISARGSPPRRPASAERRRWRTWPCGSPRSRSIEARLSHPTAWTSKSAERSPAAVAAKKSLAASSRRPVFMTSVPREARARISACRSVVWREIVRASS